MQRRHKYSYDDLIKIIRYDLQKSILRSHKKPTLCPQNGYK